MVDLGVRCGLVMLVVWLICISVMGLMRLLGCSFWLVWKVWIWCVSLVRLGIVEVVVFVGVVVLGRLVSWWVS